MRLPGIVNFILGIILVVLGIFLLVNGHGLFGLIPLFIGGSLVFLGWRDDRVALFVFSHICIVTGCFLITWGIYLLPYSQPTLSHIFFRPLFWGLFSLMAASVPTIMGSASAFVGFQRKKEPLHNRGKSSHGEA
jgi:hypothetical protein